MRGIVGLSVLVCAFAFGCSEDDEKSTAAPGGTGGGQNSGGASSGGAATGGTAGATGGTGGATGGTGGATGGTGGATGGTGGAAPTCTPCDPSTAGFVAPGTLIEQAGVTIDLTGSSCAATSGPPANDELTLDHDTGSGMLFGSGSGYTIGAVSSGTFSNETGFYLLDGLPFGTPFTVRMIHDGDLAEIDVELLVSTDGIDSVCINFDPPT